MMVKVSIIIPVFNAELFLEDCLESVLKQSFYDFEVILVNDGSNDNSGRICDYYAQKDSRINVVHQENRGQAGARNIGVTLSKGKYICFVDSDDVVHPQLLERLYTIAEQENVGVTMCDFMFTKDIPSKFSNEKDSMFTVKQVDEQELMRLMLGSGMRYYVIWAMLLRRDIFDQYPFEENRIFEDTAVLGKWLVKSQRFAYIPSILYFYRDNPDGTINKPFTVKKFDRLWSWEEQERFYRTCTGFEGVVFETIKQYILSAQGFVSDKTIPTLYRIKAWFLKNKKFISCIGEIPQWCRNEILYNGYPVIRFIIEEFRNSNIGKNDES